MRKETLAKLLRWMRVLPAAIIGGFAVRFLGSLVGRFVIYGWGAVSGSTVAFSVQLVVYAMASAAFVLAGTYTAPHHRRTTALVLAILSALLSLLTHVLSQPHPGSVNYLHLSAEAAGAALAAACVCLMSRHADRIGRRAFDQRGDASETQV